MKAFYVPIFSPSQKRFLKFLMFPIIATGRILVFAQQNNF